MMKFSSWELTVWLLLITAASFTVASGVVTEPNDVCLTEERYKNISYVNIVNITETIISNQESMKEELERMKEHQRRLEKIIISMKDSLSKLSTSVSPLYNDLSITESPITASTQITKNTTLYEEFYAAAAAGNISYINAQLERSRILTWHNEEDWDRTALHIAALEGHGPVVLALLEAGASPNVKDRGGRTPVHRAAIDGNTAVLRALLQPQYHAHVNQQDDRGTTSVYWAARLGKTGALDVLLAHGADVHIADNAGESPLMQASFFGHVGTAQALINAGARLGDADDIHGWTALHRAVGGYEQEIVHLMLRNGADKSQRDKKGRTPADRAKEEGYNEIATLIDSW